MTFLSNVPVDFKDLVKKSLPIQKRGAAWLDWNYTAISPIRELNADFNAYNLELIFNNTYTVQAKAMQPLLNDVFDPNLRGITITTNNDVNDYVGFTVNWPDYLQHGNYLSIIDSVIGRYLYLGVQYDVDVYVSGVVMEADVYLTNLTAALVGIEFLTDEEIWAVFYLWNQLYGAGLIADFSRLQLLSKTSKLNTLKDFFAPATVMVEEVNGGAGIGFNKWGINSEDGISYTRMGTVMSTLITDKDNYCSLVYISKAGDGDAENVYGVIQGNNYDYMEANYVALDFESAKGLNTDAVTTQTLIEASDTLGVYLSYVEAGTANLMKDGVDIGAGYATGGAFATPTLEKFINALNNAATPTNFSNAYVGTIAEIDSSLSVTNRVFVSQVIKEYNRRIGR